MKRLPLLFPIPLTVAVSLVLVLALIRSGAQASPDVIITVNSQGDTATKDDDVLTLREAMMLATGDRSLVELSEAECDQVSTAIWGPPCHAPPAPPNLWPGADSADTIVFDPAAFPSGAVNIIFLGSALPTLDTGDDTVDGSSVAGPVVMGDPTYNCFWIESDNNTIKGLAVSNCEVGVTIFAGAYNTIGGSNPDEGNSISGSLWVGLIIGSSHHNTIEGNVTSDNGWEGVWISGGSDNIVRDNYIGTNATGDDAWPNGRVGIVITDSSGNLIENNVISGNALGGLVIERVFEFLPANDNTIRGNYIGTDSSGMSAIPNGGHGIRIEGTAPGAGPNNNVVGGTAAAEANIIAFNDGDGVYVRGFTTGNTIRGNSIHSNGGKGIELDFGGNNDLAAPVITGVGSVTGTACPNCTIDVYFDQEDEGELYRGSTGADGDGNWKFHGPLLYPANVTATATDADGNTSEFSDAVAIPEPTPEPWPFTPTPTPTPAPATPTPTATTTPSPTPTPTATPVSGQMYYCPEEGKWSIATWSGQDGTPIANALAACPRQVDAAYRIDPTTQAWTRHFRQRPEVSNLTIINDGDGVIALGAGLSAASASGYEPLRAAANGMVGCPEPGRWAISVWKGADGTETGQALSTCGEDTVAAAYYLDPQTQTWLRWFAARPDVSNLQTLSYMQGVVALGSTGPIVFRGTVVDEPSGGCSQPAEETGCLFEIDVRIRDVIRIQEADSLMYEYAPDEVVTVLLWPWESAPGLAAGDLVEVSGDERLFGDCVEGLCWDAYGLLVLPDGASGNYIRRL